MSTEATSLVLLLYPLHIEYINLFRKRYFWWWCCCCWWCDGDDEMKKMMMSDGDWGYNSNLKVMEMGLYYMLFCFHSWWSGFWCFSLSLSLILHIHGIHFNQWAKVSRVDWSIPLVTFLLFSLTIRNWHHYIKWMLCWGWMVAGKTTKLKEWEERILIAICWNEELTMINCPRFSLRKFYIAFSNLNTLPFSLFRGANETGWGYLYILAFCRILLETKSICFIILINTWCWEAYTLWLIDPYPTRFNNGLLKSL